MRPIFAILLALAAPLIGCESAEEPGGSCPAGSGAIFVKNGPQGAGCYCPVGTFPDLATNTCTGEDPCGPLGQTAADGRCEDIDECLTNNGGCSPDADCVNYPQAGSACGCKVGFIGDGITCEACEPGFTTGAGSRNCQDIDECYQELDDCDPDGRCFNSPGSFICACWQGFELADDGKTCVCAAGTRLVGDSCEDIDECQEGLDDCGEHAVCSNFKGSFSCRCPFGFEGDGYNCLAITCGPGEALHASGECRDIDECFTGTDDCDANQICINTRGGYRCDCKSSTYVRDAADNCVCPAGQTESPDGGGRCNDINECTQNLDDCGANATCTNTSTSYVCRCNVGFQGDGKTCTPTPCDPGFATNASGVCVDANECMNGTAGCHPDADCFNTVGSATCRCKLGFTGDGLTCAPTQCPTGFSLATSGPYAGSCRDINECQEGTDTCAVNATCTNTQGDYVCRCNAGFAGDGETCACAPGYELIGTVCMDVNECATGTAGCAAAAKCTNTTGGFSCRCGAGYEGDGKTCTETPCPEGYKSSSGSCVDVDECALNVDDCDPNAHCTNVTGTFDCTCNAGFEGSGKVCGPIQCGPGYEYKPSVGACVDIDECAVGVDDCDANAACFNTSGGFRCTCKSPFIGDGKGCACPAGFVASGAGCVDVNECQVAIDDCGLDATCTNTSGGFTCRCNVGFQGDGKTCVVSPCQAGFESPAGGACVDVDECSRGVADCDPNANCTNNSGAFTCACKPGYTGNGKTCTLSTCAAGSRADANGNCVDIDECLEGTSNCHSNATCSNKTNGFTCTCKPGSEGNGTTTCNDIDECARNSDNCAQVCTNRAGGYDCSCNPGFSANGNLCVAQDTCANAAALGCLGECVNTNGGGFQCFGEGGISSLADPAASPYPNMQCAGGVGPEAIWYQTNQKTTFPVDCRCPQGASEPGHFRCAAPTGAEVVGEHYGSGPNAADHTNGYIEGCSTDYDADVVYFGVTWGDSRDSRRGFVIAVDPTTGNRTVVSGQYYDPAFGLREVGTGNRFDSIKDLALGGDGNLYVFEDSVPGTGSEYEDTNPDLQGRSIYKVNLANGNRTLVWTHDSLRHPEFGTCSNGKPPNGAGNPNIDIRTKQFELDEGDNFILATNRNMSPSPGNGFIRVANDGKSCTWITREGTEPGNLLFGAPGGGSGVVVSGGFDSGFGYRDGKIYATNFLTGRLFEIDTATGARSILWSGANPVLGTGPGPGVYNFFYYPLFDLWVAGGNEPNTPSNAALFDPATGATWGWMYQRPAADNTGTVGGGTGGNDAWDGPPGIVSNQLKGPILGVLSETLHHRPWCISPTEPDRLLVATDRIGIVKVEVETGNTMNFSQ